MPVPLIVSFLPAITAALGLGAAAVGTTGKKRKDPCAKDCKEKCKAKTGWLFSGRQKCIKQCRAEECVAPPAPAPDTGSGINWWYVASGVLIIASILLFVFRKKIFPAK